MDSDTAPIVLNWGDVGVRGMPAELSSFAVLWPDNKFYTGHHSTFQKTNKSLTI